MQIYGMHILVHNSSKEFKDELSRCKDTLLKLVSAAVAEYKKMALGYLQFSDSISTKVIWQENGEPVNQPIEYIKCILKESGIELKYQSDMAEQDVADITTKDNLGQEQYANIASYLEEQCTILNHQITEKFKKTVSDIYSHAQGTLFTLCKFPEQHRALKKRLKADNNNPEFVKIFERNFKPKSIEIIDHLFFFFETFQKTLTDTIVDSLKQWNTEYDTVIKNIQDKLDEQCRSLKSMLSEIQKLKAMIRTPGEMSLQTRGRITAIFEDLQLNIAKCALTIAGEISKAIRFSFEFTEKTLNSLVKVFEAIQTHSDTEIEISKPHSIDSVETIESEQEDLYDYFVMDPELVSFLRNSREIPLAGQLIYEPEVDAEHIDSNLEKLLGGWLDYVAPYLHSLDEQKEIMVKLTEMNALPQPKNQLLSNEISLMLEASDEDMLMGSTYKYSGRITKGGLPRNGTMMLMNEYLVFFSKTLGENINLIVPYRCISGLRMIKNFIGQSNGLTLTTPRGEIELFLSDKQSRDAMANRLQISTDSLRLCTQTPLFVAISVRKIFNWFDSAGKVTQVLIPKRLSNRLSDNVWRSAKQMGIRYLDASMKSCEAKIPHASVRDIVLKIFGQDSKLLSEWKNKNGATQVRPIQDLRPPAFMMVEGDDFGAIVYSFAADFAARHVISEYDLEKFGKVTEKFTILFSHVDQVSIILSAVCPQKNIDISGTFVVSQGELANHNEDMTCVHLVSYLKRGTTLIPPFDTIYGQPFADMIINYFMSEPSRVDLHDQEPEKLTVQPETPLEIN